MIKYSSKKLKKWKVKLEGLYYINGGTQGGWSQKFKNKQNKKMKKFEKKLKWKTKFI